MLYWALYDKFRRGAGSDVLETKAINPKSIEQARDPDLRKSLVALKRAAKRARLRNSVATMILLCLYLNCLILS